MRVALCGNGHVNRAEWFARLHEKATHARLLRLVQTVGGAVDGQGWKGTEGHVIFARGGEACGGALSARPSDFGFSRREREEKLSLVCLCLFLVTLMFEFAPPPPILDATTWHPYNTEN